MKIGVVIELTDYTTGVAPRYGTIRRFAQHAEALGFDSIWLYDHLLYRFVPGQPTLGIWECWSMLSALAEATERVEIGTLVACNAFRSPALLAKMAETVDEISEGRLILGIGAGWNKAEYDAFGFPFDRRREKFEEAVQIVRTLLKKRRLDFDGKHYRLADCEIAPRGPRADGVPLLIGAFGERMMRNAARYGDIWNTGYTGAADTFAAPLARFRDACTAVGRDAASVQVSALANVWFENLGAGPPSGADDSSDSAVINGCLVGDEASMVRELERYRALGTAHLMCHCWPGSAAALEQLAAVVRRYRSPP